MIATKMFSAVKMFFFPPNELCKQTFHCVLCRRNIVLGEPASRQDRAVCQMQDLSFSSISLVLHLDTSHCGFSQSKKELDPLRPPEPWSEFSRCGITLRQSFHHLFQVRDDLFLF